MSQLDGQDELRFLLRDRVAESLALVDRLKLHVVAAHLDLAACRLEEIMNALPDMTGADSHGDLQASALLSDEPAQSGADRRRTAGGKR